MSGPRAVLRLATVLALVAAFALVPRSLVDAEQAAADLLPDGPVAGAVRFEAAPGTVVTAAGGRYQGTLEVRPRSGDLVVVNDVDFDQYVMGLAEMPASWPMEALKAQAVAARTYGWFEHAQGRWRAKGYDVCATTACQVFKGVRTLEGTDGDRWREAVEQTAGEVLVSGGEPILARYFSTSGGLRWANHVIFPSSGRYPYLVGGPDPDDAISPYHRWEVRFSAREFQELLSRGRSLSAAVPYARVESLPSTTPGLTRAVRVTGQDGTVVEVGSVAFRSFVSSVAPDLWPDRYPGPRIEGPGSLPSTMPSSRFDVDVRAGEDVVITGRGWGHGVGLGQYGAKGKAERGLDHREILAAYYNGLEPVVTNALPARVRVGLASTEEPVEVHLDGPARLVVGGTVVTDRALGTWTVRPGPGGTVLLDAPQGFGEPLEVDATSSSRATPREVEVVTVGTRTNKTVELVFEVRDPDTGLVVHQQDLGVRPAGAHELAWSLDDGDRDLPAGEWDLALVATDEEGVPSGAAARIRIRPFGPVDASALPPSVLLPPSATGPTGDRAVPFAVAVGAGALAGLALGVAATRRRPSTVSLADL